ncbi:MAG: site-specific integrase [Hydrogenophaga sp.]|nr:site-specific integrase [Hydrogenophaga sp.]MDZ4212996.1 site-specific integrase [Methylotenera sp.]
MPVVKLSQDFIAHHLLCPATKLRIEWCDKDLPGLFIEVRSSSQGQGTYYYRYRDINRKTCTQRIGRTTDLDLTEARKQAKALRAEIALGADPRADEKASRAVITFNTLFNDHYLPYIKPRKRSWIRDVDLNRRISVAFGDKRLNQVSRLQIQSFHSSLLKENLAPATANHHLKMIRHMLNLAVEWDMLEKNPASRIHMFEENNKIERYMDEAQLGNLLDVLKSDSRRSVCLIATFLLATGCRLNEALTALWTQVDQDKRVFRVSASNSKSKRMRPVPLNDTAIEVINQLDTKGIYAHLFINKRTKKPYVNIAKVWEQLRAKAGLPNLRIHDLRHQAASNLINSGSSLYIVQQILGHSDPSVTQRYAHLSMK